VNVMLSIIPGRWRDVQPRFGRESAFLQGFERWVTPYTVFAQLSTVPMRNAYGLSRLFSTCSRLHPDFVVNGARFALEKVGGFPRFPSGKIVKYCGVP